MTSTLDKLGLKPGEKRLVVFVALAVFVVLNFWLVFPQFGKVAYWKQQRKDALKKLQQFQAEIQKRSQYEKRLRTLERLGAAVASSQQALQLQRVVASQATLSGVAVERYDPSRRSSTRRTNSFFEEQTLVVTVNTGEKELVDFLYNLGKKNQLIRVRGMNLGPDPRGTRLRGTITLVASFQKKAPARHVRTVARAAARATNRASAAHRRTNRPPSTAARPSTRARSPARPPTTSRKPNVNRVNKK